MSALFFSAALFAPTGQQPPPKADQPLEPARVDAVVVPEGRHVMLRTKTTGPITDIINSDEKVIRVMADRGGARALVFFEAKSAGVCRLTIVDKDGKKDELVVVVEKKAEEKKPKK